MATEKEKSSIFRREEGDVIQHKMTLPTIAPFRLDFTVWTLRRRSANRIDFWDNGCYSRILVMNGEPVRIMVEQPQNAETPTVHVTLTSTKKISASVRMEVLGIVRDMLGVTVDLQPFYELALTSRTIRSLVQTFIGVKPPSFPDLFEALVNAVSCQQLSLDVGIIVMNRLAERFGVKFTAGGQDQHAFPRPDDLTDASEEEIKSLGYSYGKARAIKNLARIFRERPAELSRLAKMDNDHVVQFLTTLRGVGRWSAQYALLRGLGRLDVFPGDDVGARNNLQRLFHLIGKPNRAEIDRLTSPWGPYRGMIYFHLLLERLRAKGLI